MEHVEDAKVKFNDKNISVILPMTKPTGKIRLKRRNSFYEYGEPFAARQNPISLTTYVEWQIGYDLLKNEENASKTSLHNLIFKNYQGKTKYAYELSEIIYYAHQNGMLSDNDISSLKHQIQNIPDSELLENIKITRSNSMETKIGGLNFYKMEVSYPLVVHKFGSYDIYAEIINREKQRAVGVQPMLYLCIPITSVIFENNVVGRTLEPKECSVWKINRDEAKLSLELFRIFGMLSAKHRFDTLAILDMLFPNIK